MVNTSKKNFSLFPGGNYGNSTIRSTEQSPQVNDGSSGLVPEGVGTFGVLRRSESTQKLSVETGQDTSIISNKEKEQWLKDSIDEQTTMARK